MATFTITSEVASNLPPSVIGKNEVKLNNGDTYTFTQASITTQTKPPYLDPEGDLMSKFKLVSIAGYNGGEVKLNGVTLAVGQEVDYTRFQVGNVTYVDDGTVTAAHESSFTFNLSDLGSNQFSSTTGTFNFKVYESVNAPPSSVGDRTENISYGETLVFTRAMFTSLTNPAYSDPESDAASLLRVIVLPASGLISLNGTNISAYQEISFTDIDAGNLIFNGDLKDLYSETSSFEFEVADIGSGIFVG